MPVEHKINLTDETKMNKLQKLYDYHGGPYDRGNSDSYYRRGMNPHYWPDGTMNGTMVGHDQMTELEIEAYKAGYEYNEENGDKKCWR
tara:strand:- start:1776 stop:2039 length:264 start_codon:yes stop_codon:yes gene_type:complete